MSITVPLEGFGGGSNPLNFKVVGGTVQPENPRENTIWVNTDVSITSWIFSATEPQAPAEGMVWFPTGTSSSAEFNALKKNGIQVYPLSVKQYVSGAWVTKTEEIFQGGTWAELIAYLYKNGNTYDDFTGGLKAYAYKPADSGSTVTSFTIENSEGVIKTSTIGEAKAGTVFVENAIDLTNFRTLEINVTSRTGVPSTIGMGVTKTKANNYTRDAVVLVDNTGKTVLDVTNLTGEYYICVNLGGSGNKQLSFDLWSLR